MLLNSPARPSHRLVLAHGAGAPMDSEFMNCYAGAMAEYGIEVVRFEFPYMAERRVSGKKRPPNRAPELLSFWSEAIQQLPQDGLATYIGGKSMGGRMATMLVEQFTLSVDVKGVVCLGYPFHPVGKPQRTRVEHLQQFQLPCLIVQGERDKLGLPEEVGSYDLDANISLVWLPYADHDFRPLKVSGQSQQDCIHVAAQASASFISSV